LEKLMAAKVQDELGDLAEINVTPLVDVMLVLLIIFIITSPMLVQGLKVNLPKQDAPGLTSKSPSGAARDRFTSRPTRACPTASSSASWRFSTRSGSSRWEWSPTPRNDRWIRFPKS
jgi:hypothetical protein